MNIESYADLIREANAQTEPQRTDQPIGALNKTGARQRQLPSEGPLL
ncbi:hypothetical protein VCSRO210_2481 [Vibrio cholerae]|jgi:hypothetical protein|nr:hypothetical protein [Vibrio cholerae]GHX97559.1 hypothetical protein VCSRO210_2481 [Vibrio cholerae]